MTKEERDKLIKSAEKHLKRGNVEEIRTLYHKLSGSTPLDTSTINYLGDLCARFNKIDESILFFRKVAEEYERKGFDPQAAAMWKKIIKLKPSDAEPYFRLAELYQGKKLTIEAKRNYLSAAKGYMDKKDCKNAILAYGKLQQLEPENLKLREEIAGLLVEMGDRKRAAEEFLGIASASESSGNMEEALKFFRRVVSLDSSCLAEVGKFIQRVFSRGMKQEAILFAEDLYLSMPASGENAALLASLFMELKNYSDARKILNKALEGNPSSSYLIKMALGKLLQFEGEIDKSFEYYNQAADDLIHEGKYQEASRAMGEFLKDAPENIRGLEKQLEVTKLTNNKEEMAHCYRSLEKAYQKQGMSDQASWARAEIEKMPHVIPVFREAGRELISEKTLKGEELVGPLKKEEYIDEQMAIANAYRKHGMKEKSVNYMDRLSEKYPEEEEVLEELIHTLCDAGEKEKASKRAVELAALYERGGKTAKAIAILGKAFGLSTDRKAILERIETLGGGKVIDIFQQRGGIAEEVQMAPATDDEIEIKIEEEAEEAERITTIDETLKVFKEKVKQDVGEDDFKTHYDLAVAYKEMELYDEAINEFLHARQDEGYFVDGSLMISLCQMSKGEMDQARKTLEESIMQVANTKKTLWLKYELAGLYEKEGKLKQAYDLFQEILDADPTFKDAEARADKLSEMMKESSS
ncbi:MAG: tetratricopeptide repeat protein [Acidobacteriota bacterium]